MTRRPRSMCPALENVEPGDVVLLEGDAPCGGVALSWNRDGVYLDITTAEGQQTRIHLTVREVEQRDVTVDP